MGHQKLSAIRVQSCYPAFRSFISLFATIGYIAAVLLALFGILVGAQGGSLAGIFGGLLFIGGACLLALVIKAAAECGLMLADIADCSVIDVALTASNPSPALEAAQPGPSTGDRDQTLAELMQQSKSNQP